MADAFADRGTAKACLATAARPQPAGARAAVGVTCDFIAPCCTRSQVAPSPTRKKKKKGQEESKIRAVGGPAGRIQRTKYQHDYVAPTTPVGSNKWSYKPKSTDDFLR